MTHNDDARSHSSSSAATTVRDTWGHMLRRPSSSHLDRWIQEQQGQADNQPRSSSDSSCHPVLAYPRPSSPDDKGTHDSVDDDDDDDDISKTHIHQLPQSKTPSNFHFSYRSVPLPIVTPPESPPPSRSPSRLSLFSRKLIPTTKSTNPTLKHARSTSLSGINGGDYAPSPENRTVHASLARTVWKWRPSVLGHFSVPKASNTAPSLPRPSTSSYPSTDEETLPKMPLPPPIPSSHRVVARNRFFEYAAGSASSPSLWSQPTSFTMSSNSNDTPPLAPGFRRARIPFPEARLGLDIDDHDDNIDDHDDNIDAQPSSANTFDRSFPYVEYSAPGFYDVSRVLSSFRGSMRKKKKKKLIVRGIGFNEHKKLEAAMRWCETFGEVNQITRMPNEDLHVDFTNADVAENACRLRAMVSIAGVGSVYLSWFVGHKP